MIDKKRRDRREKKTEKKTVLFINLRKAVFSRIVMIVKKGEDNEKIEKLDSENKKAKMTHKKGRKRTIITRGKM